MNLLKRLLISFSIISVFPLLTLAADKRYNIPIGDSPSWGPKDAPVTIIEFIDYQ
jgi:hypothetical protein